VLWLLEELGTPYEIVRYQRRRDLRAPAELRAIQPLGKSPDAFTPVRPMSARLKRAARTRSDADGAQLSFAL